VWVDHFRLSVVCTRGTFICILIINTSIQSSMTFYLK
jgi:hypothetical protein